MATKKAAEVKDEVKLEEEQVQPAKEAEPTSEWDEEMEILVPRKPKGEDQQYYVCVNDRRYMIPANGKMQKMPKPIALVLLESIEAEGEADDFADHIPNRSGDQPQQHAI